MRKADPRPRWALLRQVILDGDIGAAGAVTVSLPETALPPKETGRKGGEHLVLHEMAVSRCRATEHVHLSIPVGRFRRRFGPSCGCQGAAEVEDPDSRDKIELGCKVFWTGGWGTKAVARTAGGESVFSQL